MWIIMEGQISMIIYCLDTTSQYGGYKIRYKTLLSIEYYWLVCNDRMLHVCNGYTFYSSTVSTKAWPS